MASSSEHRWDDLPLVASAGTQAIAVGERTVLFDDASQTLFELNDTAAAIWTALRHAGTIAGAAEALAGDAQNEDVRRHVRTAALDWIRQGALTPAGLFSRPKHSFRFQFAGACIEVQPFGDLDVAPILDIASGLFTEAEPVAAIQVAAFADLVFIAEPGRPTTAYATDAWAPELKARLTARFLDFVHDGFFLHAALLSRAGQGLLICGRPGAGKTTLSVALAAAGFGYRGDDIAWFDPNGGVIGATFAPAAKSGAWPLLDWRPEIDLLPVHRRRDDQRVKYLPMEAQPQAPIPIGAVLLLAREDAASATIEPVDALDVVTALLDQAFSVRGRLSPDLLKTLVSQIETSRLGRLRYADLDEAVRLIAGFAP